MVDEKLKYILDNVNNWLKFNETKNAALITMLVALIVCCVTLLKDTDKIIPYQYLVRYFLVVLSLVLFYSLWSIFAKLDNHAGGTIFSNGDYENILYYGDIANMNEEYFLTKVYEKYTSYKQPFCFSEFQQDLANQIVINSRVSLRKAKRFNQAIEVLFWSMIFGIVIFVYIA